MQNSAAGLERVSTLEQAQGFSLESQRKGNEYYAQKKGFDIKKTFTIHESASKSEQRKIFRQMMDYVERYNIKHIICEKVDRFSRNIVEAKLIYDWLSADEERNLHFIKENLIVNKNSKSHEKFNLNIKVTMAQFFADNLSEEVRKGQEEKLAQNYYPGSAKFGYKKVEVNGHNIQVPDEKTSPYVKKTLELFATGNYSVNTLSEKMYADGLRSNKGCEIYGGGIHRLLINPFYYGDFIWNDELHHGKHEPLITKDTYERNQSLLNRKNIPKYTKHNYLLKGLTICTGCNHAITWELQKGKLYGYCNHHLPCSQTGSVKENEIEIQLLEYLHTLQLRNTRIVEWIRKAIKEEHKDEIDYHQGVLEELNNKLTQAQKRLDNLLDLRVDEQIDKETYKNKFKEYSDEKDRLTDSIKNHSQEQVKHVDYSVSFYDLSQRAKEIYLKAKNLEDKRRLLRLMFSSLKIETNTQKLTHTYTKPFQILYDLVSMTNGSNVGKLVEKQEDKFELVKKPDVTIQNAQFLPLHPDLRRG